MKVLQRYFASEVIRTVTFVLLALLSLFTFFDLMEELKAVGLGSYKLQHALLYVLLGLPGYVYEFMPIAVLIGTVYVLAQFASSSEFTVMRAASMSTKMAAGMLAQIGLVFVVITFFFGEYLAPVSTQYAESLKLKAKGEAIKNEFKSGSWGKDLLRENGLTGAVTGVRFFNVREVQADKN